MQAPSELYLAALAVAHSPACHYIAVLMDEHYILPPTFPKGEILSYQHGTICTKWEAREIVNWFLKNATQEERYSGCEIKKGAITNGSR